MEFMELVKRTEFDLDSLLGRTDAWIAVLDREQKILATNQVYGSLLEPVEQEISGKKLGDVIQLGHLSYLMEKGVCFISQPILLGDKKLVCSYAPVVEDQQLTGGVWSVDNEVFSPNDTSYLELQDLVQSTAALMEIARAGVIVVDRDGNIIQANQAFANLLGTAAQELVGRHILKAYPNSKPSRLPVVMETGRAEIAEPHHLGGRDVVVCRYPLIRNGKVIGAIKHVLFNDVRDVTLLASRLGAESKTGGSRKAVVSAYCDFRHDVDSIIGHSKAMKDLKKKLLRVAERGSSVILRGESGTGKELFAHAIYAASKRRFGPFIRVNCAAIPEHLLESELFGYVDGAFTGAKKGGQVGKFQLAHAGTLFLDEIGDMPLTMQAKLLRVIQEKELTPLGGHGPKQVDVRIIAATNINLEQLVKDGKFRFDLYYRLNVIALPIPPLRERRGDIYYIARHFIDIFNADFGLNIENLDPAAWEVLDGYDFPGNIRELRNVLEYAFNVAAGPKIKREDLPDHILQSSISLMGHRSGLGPGAELARHCGREPLPQIVADLERALILGALKEAEGNKLRAASKLGISRTGLYKKMRRFRLE